MLTRVIVMPFKTRKHNDLYLWCVFIRKKKKALTLKENLQVGAETLKQVKSLAHIESLQRNIVRDHRPAAGNALWVILGILTNR